MIFTMMKSSIALSAILACSVNAIADEPDNNCFGTTEMTTELDFFNSDLTDKTLHKGGTLHYEGIGFARGRKIDLVVSVVPGTTYSSKKADEDENKNGLNGEFGSINLFTVLHDHESGEGNFRFCFQDHESGDVATVDSFLWSVYDVDERGSGDENGIKEKMIMDLSQTKGFSLYPDVENSELVVSCEDESDPPCAENVRTVFHSSVGGGGGDNPKDPNDLDELQKKRSIVFAFENVSCWDFTYDHYCRIEQEEPGAKCSWYGGGNFLFSGEAKQVVDEGECVQLTESPTVSPTESPTESPSIATAAPFVKFDGEPTPDDIKFPEPECSNDVRVLKTSGSTGFPDSNNAVSIVSKDTETVTVSLNQVWDTESIGYIFYEYDPDEFDTKCYEEDDVTMGSTYSDEITIQCFHMTPVARLKICLADPIENQFLETGDGAEIPQCCHSEGVPAGTPVVCYTLEINCKPGCEEDDTQQEDRRLRGSK